MGVIVKQGIRERADSEYPYWFNLKINGTGMDEFSRWLNETFGGSENRYHCILHMYGPDRDGYADVFIKAEEDATAFKLAWS